MDAPPAWSPAKRIAFRFFFSYFLLYIFPFPLEYVPFLEKVFGFYQTFLDSVVTWVGRTVFHVAITVQPNGSGDTTWNYVQVFCYAGPGAGGGGGLVAPRPPADATTRGSTSGSGSTSASRSP